MAFSYVSQIREALVASGAVRYDVTTAVTDKGDLPDSGFFLLEVIEPDDPKRDELARVSGIADFTEYGVSRQTAIRTNAGFYRSAVVILRENDLIDANNASLQLKDQLNQLVTDYQFYLDQFFAPSPGESLFFPQADVGLLTPLIAEYEAAVADVEEQEALVATKEDECSEAEDALTAAQAEETAASDTLDALDRALASLNAALTALQAIQTANNLLSPQVDGTLDEWADQRGGVPASEQTALDAWMFNPSGTLYDEYTTGWVAAQTVLAQDIATVTAEIAAVQAEVSSQQSRLTTAETAAATAQTSVATCAAELEKLNQVLATLKANRTALLTQIIALCPDYTP